MLSAEQELLGSLTISLPQPVARQRLLLGRAHPQTLVESARREGLAGMLNVNLRRSGLIELLPAPAAERLDTLYRRTAALNMQKIGDLRALSARLERSATDLVVLKGMALLEALYGDPGLRATGDIDVWVSPEHRTALVEALDAEGYAAQPFYPDTFRRGTTAIDIHTHILSAERIRSRQAIFAAGEAPMLAHRRATCFGDTTTRLAPPQEALLLALHLMKHNADRLLWLIEINELVAASNDDEWRQLVTLADAMMQTSSLARVAYLASLLLPHTATRRLRDLAEASPPRGLYAGALRQRATRGNLPAWGPLLFFSSQRGVLGRAASILETLFPRPYVLRQVFRDAESSPWRLYLRRVGQLVGFVFR